MNRKIFRFLILILNCLLAGICIYSCIQEIGVCSNDLYKSMKYYACIARCTIIIVFIFMYFFSFSSSFESAGLFIPIFFFFFLMTELKIIDDLSVFNNYIVFPPDIFSFIYLFSNMTMTTSLIGYGIFYTNQNKKSANYYLMATLICNFLITSMLPKPQIYKNLWNISYTRNISIGLFLIGLIVFFVLIFTESRGSERIRKIFALFIMISAIINMLSLSTFYDIIGTVSLIIGLLAVMIISKICDINF